MIWALSVSFAMGYTPGSSNLHKINVKGKEMFQKCTDIKSTEAFQIKKEYDTLKTLNHPHILKVYDYYTIDTDIVNGRIENKRKKCFSMEVLDGNVEEYMKSIKKTATFEEKQAVLKQLAIQVREAVKYIHSRFYIHRDINRRNVFYKIQENGQVLFKLADFDVSQTPLCTVIACIERESKYFKFSYDTEYVGWLLWDSANILFDYDFSEIAESHPKYKKYLEETITFITKKKPSARKMMKMPFFQVDEVQIQE
jgi:serine/threonine protein kinase